MRSVSDVCQPRQVAGCAAFCRFRLHSWDCRGRFEGIRYVETTTFTVADSRSSIQERLSL